MKKNELTVWRLDYQPIYYLTHPWIWIKDTYWNLRNFIHRGRYGFAFVDVWNFCNWWPEVGAAALKYMAEHGTGYPGSEPYDTHEKWRTHLLTLADELKWCSDSMDICYTTWHDMNEYAEEYEKMRKRYYDENGSHFKGHEMTAEDREIEERYLAREKEIEKEFDKKRAKIFSNIGENLVGYWD